MKKVLNFFLGILFIVIVVAIIVVCSYTLTQPSREGETRSFINGIWYTNDDSKGNNDGIAFKLTSDGDFSMYYYNDKDNDDDDEIITKGYFKVDEDSDKIKLMVLPKYKNEDFGFDYSLYFFTNFKYKDLEDTGAGKKNSDETQDVRDATVTFVIDDKVFECTQTREDTLYD